MINNLRNIFRLIRIGFILSIHGALFPFKQIRILYILFFPFMIFGVFSFRKTKGQRLVSALNSLGPTFIKFGQLLATRTDLVGEELANDLSHLQDRLPAFKFKKVKKIIEQELGKEIDDLFSIFEEKAVAAASIAQVHKASTFDGKLVAVKILRPNIKKRFTRDLKLLLFVAKILNHKKNLKRLKLKEVVRTLEKTVYKELDLRFEAASASKLKENLMSDKHIIIPEIHWDKTSSSIMVSQWLEGIRIDDIKNLKKGKHDLEKIAENLHLAYLNQAYRDGFFHADMHPGNLKVDKDGNIIILDFGIMGNLSEDDRLFISQIFYGFLKRDYNLVAKTHLRAGYIPPHTDIDDFALACRSIGEAVVGIDASKVSIAKILAQLFKITEDFGMETQSKLLLLQKTMLLIEGICSKLEPEINLWDESEPWLKAWLEENLHPKNKLQKTAKEICEFTTHTIPHLMKTSERIINDTMYHGLKLHPDTIAQMTKKRKKCDKVILAIWILLAAGFIYHLV